MPGDLTPSRLARDELEALQQKALREWRASDWLATHRPRQWQEVNEQSPTLVCVDLGAGVGESEEREGYIALDHRHASRGELRSRSGETRLPDIHWDLDEGLPFEDDTVDHFHAAFLLRDLARVTYERTLPAEIARTLKVAGVLHLRDDAAVLRPFAAALQEHGLALEQDAADATDDSPSARKMRLVKIMDGRSSESEAPRLVDERVLGERRIPTVRQPVPS